MGIATSALQQSSNPEPAFASLCQPCTGRLARPDKTLVDGQVLDREEREEEEEQKSSKQAKIAKIALAASYK